MDFSWAQPYPEIHKICTLFQLNEVSNPEQFTYTPLQGYIQEGPQCGLVALAMLKGNPSKETVTEILNRAKNNNFTYNGEIFSAYDMQKLSEEYLCDCSVKVYSGCLDNPEIKSFLLNKGFILVPYDTEKDNSPGLNKGHKAHWAVISGALKTEDDFFVIARHGKAKNVALWKLSKLAASNAQLFEFSPDRKLQDIDYKLPEGGIAGPLGLNKKAVLIQMQ